MEQGRRERRCAVIEKRTRAGRFPTPRLPPPLADYPNKVGPQERALLGVLLDVSVCNDSASGVVIK